jgi:surfeit locus 1 family protein
MKKYIPLIFTAFSFVILMAMGSWQVQRLQWKTNLMNQIQTNLAKPPLAIENAPEEYRLMTLTGTYDFANEMTVIGRPMNGKPGVHIITPMKIADKTILINRGWAKYDAPYTKPAGEVTVTGIIRSTTKRNFLSRHITMDNIPAQNMWFYVDLPAMHQHIKTPQQQFYVEATGKITTNSYPYTIEAKINLYNEHLSYAITWYSLAIALLIIYYFRFHRR